MKKIFFFFVLFVCAVTAQSQTQFFSKVKIEFEKKVSVRQQYREMAPEWYDMIKDHLPATATSYFDFIGDSTKSIYKPGREVARSQQFFYEPIADKNVVYSNFSNSTVIDQKPVFEETFLMQDSLLKITWKLTPDIRTIAGYDCRKAFGIIDDTIGVFAYYTDEIMISGGPETIHGLPGMILGLAIPRLHTSWFATKVEVFDVNVNSVVPATKGKKVTRSTMIQSLDKVLKNWGTYGNRMMLNFLI